jgi:hypothetical protein
MSGIQLKLGLPSFLQLRIRAGGSNEDGIFPLQVSIKPLALFDQYTLSPSPFRVTDGHWSMVIARRIQPRKYWKELGLLQH